MRLCLRPSLIASAAAQQGLFTRRQAVVAGHSPDDIRARIAAREGGWNVVRRGVYIDAELWRAASDAERWWWCDVAAHLLMERHHLLSHDSAARGLGLPLLRGGTDLSHITREGVGGSRTRHGVKHHLGRELPADVVERDGIPMTGLARTALDVGREHGFACGVVAIDAALRRGVTHRDFELELARMTSWPYVCTCRSALAFADPGAESPGESLVRILLAEMGCVDIETQFAVPVPGGIRWCDLRVGRHLVEFDGKVKYVPRAAGGFADVDPAEVAFRDRRRDTEVAVHDLGLSHLTWYDLFGGREAAKTRLRHEIAITERRFGTRLPEHLVRFAREHPRPRRTLS